MGVTEDDPQQGRVVVGEPGYRREWQIDIGLDGQRPAEIQDDARSVVLDLDIVATDFMGTAKDPDSHVFNCSRGGLKPQPISNRHDPPMFYIAVFNKRRRGGLGHGVREGSRGVYLFDGVGEATSRRRYLSSRTATARIQPPVPPTILMGKPMYVKRRPTSS